MSRSDIPSRTSSTSSTPTTRTSPVFEFLWNQIDSDLRSLLEGSSLEGNSLIDDLRPIIISKVDRDGGPIQVTDEEVPPVPDISYPFAADIVGNTISADLIDYL